MLRQEKETPAPEMKLIETSVNKAKNELLEAENNLKDKNYMPALYHYINTITHAKNAIEEKLLEDNSELCKSINQAITGLLSIATEQNDLFEKCNDDTKVKLALTLIILNKTENIKKNIPILEVESNILPLTKILEEKKAIVIKLAGNHPDIGTLLRTALSMSLKQQYDQRKADELVAYEIKKTEMTNAPTFFKPKEKPESILQNPLKFGAASIIPGAAVYSMANVGLQVILWGGFYGAIAGAIACYAGNKLAEYCKPKR